MPFSIVVIVGSSNAVNLTDGIDGLAVGLVGISVLATGILVYISGNFKFSQYLQVLYIPGTGGADCILRRYSWGLSRFPLV